MDHLVSEKVFKDHKEYLEQDKEYMVRRGYYSFIGGVVALVVSIMWIIVF